MSDRLTDAELDRLERDRQAATKSWALGDDGHHSRIGRRIVKDLPALLAEVREHRKREAAHRAALDTLVDGDGR